ncbi:MAG: type II secretion system ATPase GspE [Bdellovibrionota bacterium]
MAINQANSENDVQESFEASPKMLAEFLGLRYVERLEDPNPPRELIRGDFSRLAGSWGRNQSTVPIAGNDHEILVATSDPLNTGAMDQLRLCYAKPIRMIVTSPAEVQKAINAIRTSLMSDRSSELTQDDDNSQNDEFQNQLKIDVTDAEDDDAPIIRYVNAIIFKASSERASDVHIEPYEDKLNVRFRVDGVLHDVASEEKSFQAAILSRIKVMAGLNIAEKRLPQDGRIGIKIAGKNVDIRVSTVPTQYGERIVMRLLDKTATVLDLEIIGLAKKNIEKVDKLIRRPNGIILVTGPTGSGKTTTLYSCLTKINTPELNILTVEDPVEYELEGIGQMQVNPKIDFTFASGLRAILRQDPDVVMVGEIRDAETAEIAIQASLTGHLVFSTLHTNDSPGAITRLIDMGVEPFLVSSSVLAIMAQRLIRKLCDCKETYEMTDEEFHELGVNPASLSSRTAFKAAGCEKCQFSGYKGRSGIHELLIINDDIRSLILQRVDSSTIKAEASKHGFETLRLDGARKILQGVTSVEEVLMVTQEDS